MQITQPTHDVIPTVAEPPSFEEGGTLRQQARASGMDPDYWYAVEEVRNMKPGTSKEVIFWKRSIALFRTKDGSFRAIENRCLHRQIKLTLGEVEGCELVCAYHGWKYNGEGRVTEIPDLFGRKKVPKLAVRNYPVQVRYGLVWVFPGDPKLADSRHIPDIPELEGPKRWSCVPISFECSAHHSMIIDNVSDFSHAYLHRRFRPFVGAELVRFETVGDDVHLSYNTKVGRGKISSHFVDHDQIDTNHMDLCFKYPYQWSNTDEQIKHWLFVLPIDESRSRTFFLFYFKSLKIPYTPIRIPRWAMEMVLKIANRRLIGPLLTEDQFAMEAEQDGYQKFWGAPPIEVNPVVRAFQKVTVRKWREHLDREANANHDTA
ncbi:MAG: Rieske 2Fe-2S domain-containing protein [Bacteroidetes bacterium]|nr:Rieske 2Fe-2S domain-containing protein [Bacteroidota bacterium]MCY4232191.1 Rieske 2Fe-2S domain-containing protein [Bacteroidota bacterium]